MKKLIVLLLAFAMVGAVSAQVTTAVSLSGSVYLRNNQTAAAPSGKVSPNGSSYDVLTLKGAGKDNKFGFEVIDYDLISAAAFNVDYWDVWYDLGYAKATMGALNGGSYVQYFSNGWLENYDPTDNIKTGILFETSALVQGLKVGAFIPSGTDAYDNVQSAVVGASFAATGLTVRGQVNLGLVAPKNTIVNAGFQFTGVKGLNTYGWTEYGLDSESFGYGVGAEYKAATWRAGAEFEGVNDDWGVIASLRYYVTPALFVQLRPEYRSSTRMRVRGYVNYAFGNGFSVEGMLGYDDQPKASPVFSSLIDYIKFGYSVAF